MFNKLKNGLPMFAIVVRGLLRAVTVALLLGVASTSGFAAVPDYGLLDEVLLHNVRDGYVDYDGIRADPRFDEFLRQLGVKPEPFASAQDQLAYYINAYNALAIRGVLQGYSPAGRIGRHRFFKRLKFTLAEEAITLAEIEDERIRPFGDPRIHFALVCASISCPRLANKAYTAEAIDTQLDSAAAAFINDITRNRFDIAQKTAFLSQIFEWFHEDFENTAGSLPAYLARYVQEPATRAALLEGRLAVRHLPYDWGLNGQLSPGNGE